MSRNHFLVDSLASSRYGVNPFQRVEIQLAAIDRTNPELFPSLEGDEIYCERADFPFLMSLVSPSSGVQQSFVFRTGLRIKGTFKGLYVSHPLFTTTSQFKPLASLIISKGVSTSTDNSLGDSALPIIVPFRIITNSAVAQTIGIYLPAGARRVKKLSFQIAATTVNIPASLTQFVDLNNVALTGPAGLITPGSPAVIFSYPTGNASGGPFKITAQGAAAGTFIFEIYDIPVPTTAAEFVANVTGTGLSQIGQIDCTYT